MAASNGGDSGHGTKQKGEPSASRPQPAEYFLDPEAGSGLLPWGHAQDELERARNYWIATVGDDQRPHCMPIWGVWHEGELLFSTSRRSRKARNLGANPAVVVHLESGERVVIVEGEARAVSDTPTLQAYIELYNPKYDWSFTLEEIVNHQVFAVRPKKAFAWLSVEDFGGSATRWQFD